MKLILKNIFTNRNTCYYLWFALPRANKLKVKVFSGVELHYRDLFHGKIYELLQNLTSIFLGGLLLFVTFPVFTQ